MGSRLMSAAFDSDEYQQVGANARNLLLFMAHTALDNDHRGTPGRWYFASRLKSAKAMGHLVDPPNAAADASAQFERAMLAVRRAVASLIKVHAIERRSALDRDHRVHTGRQEEYFVLVGLTVAERAAYLDQWRLVDNGAIGTEKRTEIARLSEQKVHPSSASGVHLSSARGVQSVYPQGTTSEEQLRHEQSEEPGTFRSYSSAPAFREVS